MKTVKRDQNLNRREIYTITAGSLLVLLYIVIFCFSSEDGTQSSQVSKAVTRVLLKGYYGITGQKWGTLAGMVVRLEGFVRKMAHFLEYFCVGFLSFSLVVVWNRPVRKGALLVLGQLLLSAALDELHQYFVPGRWASMKDVIIDTAGGIAGMLFWLLIYGCILLYRRKISRLYIHGQRE